MSDITEGDTVELLFTEDYKGEAFEAGEPAGTVELEDADRFEVISDHWEGIRHFYNLRLNGERDGHDFIRVWNVDAEDLSKV